MRNRWPAWDAFVADMVGRHGPGGGWFRGETNRFESFVEGLPSAERPRLLIHAYSEYRKLSEGGDLCSRSTEAACHSILISTLLPAIGRPTRAQALAILAASYHQCGHGSDVEPPLTLALAHYRRRPYDEALFDAASAYRDTLRKIRASSASNTRMRLLAILWLTRAAWNAIASRGRFKFVCTRCRRAAATPGIVCYVTNRWL